MELFVAVVEEGSVAAGARKVRMAQPNASRIVAGLESETRTTLLERSPQGSVPTAAGLVLVEQSRTLLAAAQGYIDWVRTHANGGDARELRVGASTTNAESLLPAWLAELRRRMPQVQVDLRVLNSEQVLELVHHGTLQLGFVETPHLPASFHQQVVHTGEMALVVSPDHEWALRPDKVTLTELARTALVVREHGSGTREALDELLTPFDPVEPSQVLLSNAAVRSAVAAGGAPAVLSELAVRNQLADGELLHVPLEGGLRRSLTAVWQGPRRLSGPAAELVEVARSDTR